MEDEMKKKMPFWGVAFFIPLVMFTACKDMPPASSTWKYDGTADNTIILEEGSLTYDSIRTKKLKTLSITIKKSPSEKILKETEKQVKPDERILIWLLAAEDESKVYGIIYCSIEMDQNGKVTRDMPPQKLSILEPEILADLNVKPPYTYIRE
jgi:hypothetical protein